LQIVLGGQRCQIAVYQRGQWIFVDTAANDANIFIGVIARDVVLLVPTIYCGFIGNLIFCDTAGNSDPTYGGLGGRYQLLYRTAAEYATLVQA
jgi:hypothetical protein